MKQLHNLDWNLLKAFHFLMLEKNVTKAAQRMGMTQSALSHTLNRIREQLADPILIKTSDGMKATQFSESLHQQVHPIINSLSNSIAQITEFDASTSKQCFNILVTDYSERILSQQLLPLLIEKAPNVSINFISHHESSMEKLEQGEIHLMVGSYGDLPDSFRRKTLWRDTLATVVNKQHPLSKNTQISVQDFCQFPHVFITKTGVGGGPLDIYLKQFELSRQKAVYTRSFYNALHMLTDSHLISTLPMRVAQQALESEQLQQVSIEGLEAHSWPVDMVWPNICHQDKSQQWLRALIKQACQSL